MDQWFTHLKTSWGQSVSILCEDAF
jgi:hypothetical protein